MVARWQCPTCKRQFSRTNQRHACETGTQSEVLRNRPAALVALYGALESFVASLGPVEFVTRERYVLLRTIRIFSDLVVMRDALRVAVHLETTVSSDFFIKVVADRNKVTHVAIVRSQDDLDRLKALPSRSL